MNRMRKCNDEVYQLPKDQALVKKLKNKRFRPFCLCLPGVMFVTRGSNNSLPRVTNITPRRHKQKGLNLLFFNFLTSAWSLASW
jgi:hypothetical protein